MSEKILDFIIIGAQKSATTFLHFCLKEHPEIFLPDSEVAFFENPDFHTKPIQNLERIIASQESGQVIGIKRPNYFEEEECPQNIHSLIPDAKLIVILRNPIERAVSAYFHQMSNGILPVRPLSKGMRDLLDGKYSIKYPKSKQIIEYGYYCTHIKRYLDYFDKSQFLILYYSELKRNPQKVIKEVYRYLNVSDDFVPDAISATPLKRKYNIISVYLSSIRSKLTNYIDDDSMRIHPKKELNIFSKISVKLIKLVDYLIPDRSNRSKELSPDLIHKLNSIYQPEIDCLELLLQRDFSHWSK